MTYSARDYGTHRAIWVQVDIAEPRLLRETAEHLRDVFAPAVVAVTGVADDGSWRMVCAVSK